MSRHARLVKRRWRARAAAALCVIAVTAEVGRAQAASEVSSLAKASQNPISDLVSVPLQFNFLNGGGLADQTSFTLNVQPVLPLPLGTRWTLIARTIVPFVNAPVTADSRVRGVADIQQQLFFTPVREGGTTWGAGPMFSLPTSTTDALRSGAWAAGPTAVVVQSRGPMLFGALVSQLWTFAHSGKGHDVELFSLQPFFNYNLAGGWALGTAPIITADWSTDDHWTVPLGMLVSCVTTVGRQPISVSVQYYANVVRPSSAASGQLKLVTSFLFPKAKAQ